jgi:Uma2 family endonuclease
MRMPAVSLFPAAVFCYDNGMNKHSRSPAMLPTTQAAEGLPRLRWSVADFDQLIEAGVLTEDDRVELIGGELVPMAAKGNRHENLKTHLLNAIMRRLPEGLLISIELGWRASDDTYLEPDITIFADTVEVTRVAPSDMLLVVEVAASSLGFDAGRKAQVYAALGVRDYWVIDAATCATRIYRDPTPTGYATRTQASADEVLQPLLLPFLGLKLADLNLG